MFALNRIQRSAISSVHKEVLAKAVRSYHDNIIDHYENPRNVGSLDKKKKLVGTGESSPIISVSLVSSYMFKYFKDWSERLPVAM